MYKFELQKGKTYRVHWKTQSGNYRWYVKEFTAQFLGWFASYEGQPNDMAHWSFRPDAGSSDCHKNSILWFEQVEDGKRQLPKSLGPLDKYKLPA